jgi:hypothetical protein
MRGWLSLEIVEKMTALDKIKYVQNFLAEKVRWYVLMNGTSKHCEHLQPMGLINDVVMEMDKKHDP